MITEPGDYVESETWDAVVLVSDRKPYNMGTTFHAVNAAGVLFNFEDDGSFANHGMTRSDHHRWEDGQQAEYDSLPAHGRRLYDQIRTRLLFDHDETMPLVRPVLNHPRPRTTWSD